MSKEDDHNRKFDLYEEEYDKAREKGDTESMQYWRDKQRALAHLIQEPINNGGRSSEEADAKDKDGCFRIFAIGFVGLAISQSVHPIIQKISESW